MTGWETVRVHDDIILQPLGTCHRYKMTWYFNTLVFQGVGVFCRCTIKCYCNQVGFSTSRLRDSY